MCFSVGFAFLVLLLGFVV